MLAVPAVSAGSRTSPTPRVGCSPRSCRVPSAPMLKYRLTFGPLFILLALGVAWLDEWLDGVDAPAWVTRAAGEQGTDGTWPPGVFVFPALAFMCVMAARELTRFLKSKGVPATKRLNGTLAVCGLALAAFVPETWAGTSGAGLINASVGLVLVASLMIYSRKQQVEGMLAAAGGALLSFCYLGLLMAFWVLIRRDHWVWVMLWLMLVVKSCDIGAFFTGRAIGKRKLIPWLSPGKTWEGFWGGITTSALVSMVGWMLLREADTGGSGFPMWAQAPPGRRIGPKHPHSPRRSLLSRAIASSNTPMLKASTLNITDEFLGYSASVAPAKSSAPASNRTMTTLLPNDTFNSSPRTPAAWNGS